MALQSDMRLRANKQAEKADIAHENYRQGVEDGGTANEIHNHGDHYEGAKYHGEAHGHVHVPGCGAILANCCIVS
jgi:hypothetical protein